MWRRQCTCKVMLMGHVPEPGRVGFIYGRTECRQYHMRQVYLWGMFSQLRRPYDFWDAEWNAVKAAIEAEAALWLV